ncbi:MAG: hypothetical protein KBD78_08055 [Oligoflexales bacterium]|nr:hypothetical protein [Oligoflexales bacterium]
MPSFIWIAIVTSGIMALLTWKDWQGLIGHRMLVVYQQTYQATMFSLGLLMLLIAAKLLLPLHYQMTEFLALLSYVCFVLFAVANRSTSKIMRNRSLRAVYLVLLCVLTLSTVIFLRLPAEIYPLFYGFLIFEWQRGLMREANLFLVKELEALRSKVLFDAIERKNFRQNFFRSSEFEYNTSANTRKVS